MTAIWCCIPAYNNAATIVDIATRAKAAIENVIVVDDGSTDANLSELLKSTGVTVIRHEKNLGKGAALMTALNYAAERGGQYLITVDGDGQHYPEDIPQFLPHLDPTTILIGSRQKVIGEMPPSSLFGREFSDFWVFVETGLLVADTQSGFRAYPIPLVQKLKLSARHYNFEMEALAKAIWAGLNARSIPIRVWYPEASKRVSSFKPFLDNLRISMVHTKLVFRQALPWPHRRLVTTDSPAPSANQQLKDFLFSNSGPLGLAAAAFVTVLLGIVLWPWGIIAVLYVATRLHLNKIMCLAILLLCAPPLVPIVCLAVGKMVVGANPAPGWAWFVGSHIVAFATALALTPLVYIATQRLRPYKIPAADQS